MDYKRVYYSIINRARYRVEPDDYLENHHILPKCLGGLDDSDNLVKLTAREHYVAHQLLARFYKGPLSHKLWIAVYFMSFGKKNSKFYAEARLRFKEENKDYSRQGGLIGGPVGGKLGSVEGKILSGKRAFQKKTGIHAPGEYAKNAAKSGKIAKESGQIYRLQKLVASKGGSASCLKQNSIKVECLECGMISNPGAIARHQKYKNHNGTKR
jgi:hypothetical protein